MTKASLLVTLASLYGAATKSRAEAIATKLREVGALPKGGRGPWAPEITREQAINYLLAVAAAPRVEDALGIVRMANGLIDDSGYELVPYLADLLENPQSIANVQHILIMPASKMAEVVFRDRESFRFLPAEKWKAVQHLADSQGSAYVGSIGFIGAGVLQQLALDFASEIACGWADADAPKSSNE